MTAENVASETANELKKKQTNKHALTPVVAVVVVPGLLIKG